MQEQQITIFGGSGFIGRYVVQKLASTGATLRIAVRHPDEALFLRPLGQVGQIVPICVDVGDEESISQAISGSQVVVNLIGILAERKQQTFSFLHAKVPELIAKVANDHSVGQLIHISALNASSKSRSKYSVSKALGEKKLLKNFPHAIILRPSVVFGPEDQFLNLFAKLARYSPVLPIFGGGQTKIQPVFVCDVADLIFRLVKLWKTTKKKPFAGEIFEVVGPTVYTWKEIWRFVLKETGRKRLLVPIPFWGARFIAKGLQFFPKPLLTPDQIRLLAEDNIATGTHLTLKDVDIDPASMEALASTYLKRYRIYG